MGSIESGPLETAAIFFPLPSPLPRAGEGDQDRLTISAAHIERFQDQCFLGRRYFANRALGTA